VRGVLARTLGRYNTFVPPPSAKLRVRKLEAIGIVLIALLILLVTLIRYGRHIPWSAR
jgi:hypothetical protein